MTLEGQVVTGLGQGASFTRLDWARERFMDHLGIDPWPGTLNLRADAARLSAWLDRLPSPVEIEPGQPGFCRASCWPVRIAGRLPAAIVRPAVAGYPADQVEIVSAVSLRESLDLRDGTEVTLAGVHFDGVDAVIFDVDGTLVNSVEGMEIAVKRAAASCGFAVPEDAVRRSLNEGEPLWPRIIPPERSDHTEMTRILRSETMRHWGEVLRESVRLFDGLADALARLRAAGLRLGICTGSRGESFLPLERAGLLSGFEVVVTARDVRRPKPDPEGLRACMDRLGCAPERAIYVGDSAHDVQAGRAAGMRSVGVLTGAATSAQLCGAGADRLLSSAARLPVLLGVESD